MSRRTRRVHEFLDDLLVRIICAPALILILIAAALARVAQKQKEGAHWLTRRMI